MLTRRARKRLLGWKPTHFVIGRYQVSSSRKDLPNETNLIGEWNTVLHSCPRACSPSPSIRISTGLFLNNLFFTHVRLTSRTGSLLQVPLSLSFVYLYY